MGKILCAVLPLVAAPNTYHPTEAVWSSLRRCDLLNTQGFASATGPAHGNSGLGYYRFPRYTEGAWAPANQARPSISEAVPRYCAAARTACPLGTCADGTATPSEVCSKNMDKCYGKNVGGRIQSRPDSVTYTKFVHGLAWVWQPLDGCHMSPLAASSVHGDAAAPARVVRRPSSVAVCAHSRVASLK